MVGIFVFVFRGFAVARLFRLGPAGHVLRRDAGGRD